LLVVSKNIMMEAIEGLKPDQVVRPWAGFTLGKRKRTFYRKFAMCTFTVPDRKPWTETPTLPEN
jgi:hypothetical protein